MDDELTLLMAGIYLLLLLNLTFNFKLAITLLGAIDNIGWATRRTNEEANIMRSKLNNIRRELLHGKNQRF
jgi:hypothetical protein